MMQTSILFTKQSYKLTKTKFKTEKETAKKKQDVFYETKLFYINLLLYSLDMDCLLRVATTEYIIT